MVAWIIIFTVLAVMSFLNMGQGKPLTSFARTALTLFVIGTVALAVIG